MELQRSCHAVKKKKKFKCNYTNKEAVTKKKG